MFKLFRHKDYKDKYGLYYVYIHVYNNNVIYVGKGSRAIGRNFANRDI